MEEQGGARQSGGVNIHAGEVKVDGDIVGRDKVTNIYEAAQEWKAPRQIPPPPADFTGRGAEMKWLVARVQAGGGLIAALNGMGGVGKSALALAVAHAVGAAFPDGCLYIEMGGTSVHPLPPAAAMALVIRAWHPTARLPEEQGALAGRYRSTLNGRRVLLLLDNAAGAEQVAPLCPPPAGCSLLITARARFALRGLEPLTLGTLPHHEAVALLRQLVPQLTEDEAGTLAERCGDLPLALTLAGGTLTTYIDLTPADYLRRLESHERLGWAEAALSLSYDLLDTAQQQRWRALATFPGGFARAAAAALWGEAEDIATPALSTLVAQSLVQWAPPALGETEGRYRLHDLARLFAASRMTDDERITYAYRHAAHYRALLTRTKELCKAGNPLEGLRLFDLERENIEAGQSWAAQHAATRRDAAVLCSDYPNAGVYILELRQHPREQIRWLDAALNAARHLGNRAAEGNRLGSLGLAYAALGEVRQAIDFYEQALVIAREIGDRFNEGIHLGNLGIAYKNLGEVRQAIDFYQQQLVIAREIGDRRGEGTALGNLGIAYKNLGEVRQAIDFYEQALVIAREIGDRRGEGTALGNLGNTYAALGEVRQAIDFYQQTLTIAREIGDRRGEGNALGNLGLACYSLGEVRQAINYYQQYLTIAREIGDRRGESIALCNLALTLDSLGERAKAIRHAQASLVIHEEIEDPWAETVRAALARWAAEGGRAEGEKGREGEGETTADGGVWARLGRWVRGRLGG